LSSPASKAAEQLHLCTDNQSYQVRQVSTSNSVYVIEPSIVRAASGDGDEATGLDLAPARGPEAMTAVAKVDTMLELLPVSLDARLMLERILPISLLISQHRTLRLSKPGAISWHLTSKDGAPDLVLQPC
jgi:Sister chromatid cohesion protein Dcc1